jgi:putative nucleotidyltransferase with HDIG domain
LKLVKECGLDIPFIIVSGTIGEEQAVLAMKAGASDYLVKGRLARLLPVVERELADAQRRRLQRRAERALRDREQQSVLELANAYEATLAGWGRALDLRDKETEGHSQRVTDLTVRLARAMGMSDAECVHVRRGALLHDIGKMGIPDSVLHKPAPLTPEERALMKQHPLYAMELLAPIEYLRLSLDIPYCHHEKWDGSGYPRGLKGEAIPLAARIFSAVDIWDAIRSDRPYRTAWSVDRAREHLASLAGTHLDPQVVDAFLSLLSSLEKAEELPPAQNDVLPGMGGRILVVDDYPSNVELLRRWLTSDGHTVLTASTGDAALRMVVEHHPDVVVLDIEIPAPDGFTVCRRINADPATSDIPVIFLSGLEPGAHDLALRDLRVASHLMKPVDPFELKTVVRLALERRRRTS